MKNGLLKKGSLHMSMQKKRFDSSNYSKDYFDPQPQQRKAKPEIIEYEMSNTKDFNGLDYKR
jgi:hypothetical protein